MKRREKALSSPYVQQPCIPGRADQRASVGHSEIGAGEIFFSIDWNRHFPVSDHFKTGDVVLKVILRRGTEGMGLPRRD